MRSSSSEELVSIHVALVAYASVLYSPVAGHLSACHAASAPCSKHELAYAGFFNIMYLFWIPALVLVGFIGILRGASLWLFMHACVRRLGPAVVVACRARPCRCK